MTAAVRRSVIAEALTLQLLAVHYPHLDISAQAASIGPCTSDVHEPYVLNLAQVQSLHPGLALQRSDWGPACLLPCTLLPRLEKRCLRLRSGPVPAVPAYPAITGPPNSLQVASLCPTGMTGSRDLGTRPGYACASTQPYQCAGGMDWTCVQEAGLDLPPRARKQFDELGDIVAHDLVLVMDDFDFQEVSPTACQDAVGLHLLVTADVSVGPASEWHCQS